MGAFEKATKEVDQQLEQMALDFPDIENDVLFKPIKQSILQERHKDAEKIYDACAELVLVYDPDISRPEAMRQEARRSKADFDDVDFTQSDVTESFESEV